MDDIPHRRETGLKPCPFCGSLNLDPEWEHNGQTASFDGVRCMDCGATGPEHLADLDRITAVDQWNSRPEEDRLREYEFMYKSCSK